MGGELAAVQVQTLDFADLSDYAAANRYPIRRDTLDDAGWSLARADKAALLAKLRAAGVPLKEYVNKQIYFGIKTGLNEAFIIDSITRNALIAEDGKSAELIKPYLIGRDLGRYEIVDPRRYLIFMPDGWTNGRIPDSSDQWGWLKENYPAIAKHLARFQAAAAKRWDKGDYWWELRPCDYYDKFEMPKIIYPSVAQRGEFSLDERNTFVDKTCYFVASGEKYLLGLLNSKALHYYFESIAVQRQHGYFEYLTQYVEQLPIPRLNLDDPADRARHDRMVALVSDMLALKRQHAAEALTFSDKRHELAERIARTDAQIDALTYDLYGLTDAERALVEGQPG